jgi:hypothetical protein
MMENGRIEGKATIVKQCVYDPENLLPGSEN